MVFCYYCKKEIKLDVFMGNDKSFCSELHRKFYNTNNRNCCYYFT